MLSSYGIVILVVVALAVLQRSSTQASIRPCPRIGCPEGCPFITGLNGCPMCGCTKPPVGIRPCPRIECPEGCTFITGLNGCPMCGCTEPPEKPKSCPLFKCRAGCVQDIGPDGCQIGCACPPSCKTVRCSAGYECQLVQVTCVRAPCFPQPECVKIKKLCPPQDPCNIRCKYGLKTGKNGCQLCECLEAPLS